MAVLMFSPIISIMTLATATYCIRRTDILNYKQYYTFGKPDPMN